MRFGLILAPFSTLLQREWQLTVLLLEFPWGYSEKGLSPVTLANFCSHKI